MEREYRAWDFEYNQFWGSPFAISNDGRMFWLRSDAAGCGCFETPSYDSPYYPDEKRFDITEWTGFYDRNKQKIFEKDIVKLDDGIAYGVFRVDGFLILANKLSPKDIKMFSGRVPSVAMVIGNVYENKA